MSEQKKYPVRILSRRETALYDELGVGHPAIEVSYYTTELPPGIVRIRKDEYSPEREAHAIREDIEKRLQEKPEIREV